MANVSACATKSRLLPVDARLPKVKYGEYCRSSIFAPTVATTIRGQPCSRPYWDDIALWANSHMGLKSRGLTSRNSPGMSVLHLLCLLWITQDAPDTLI